MAQYTCFSYQDKIYPLQHLNPLSCEFIQAAQHSDQTEKQYKCLIELSNHCFTKGVNIRKGEKLSDFPAELWVDNGKEKRIFCFERYHLSLKLPDILKTMDKTACFFRG